MSEQAPISEQSIHAIEKAVERVINTELAELEHGLRDVLKRLTRELEQLSHSVDLLKTDQQKPLLETTPATNAPLVESNSFSPYDDIDIRLDELRSFLDERTRHWRIYENIFYGLVIMLLLTNMILLGFLI